VQAQGLVKLAHNCRRQSAQALADALDGYRSHLLGLCLRVTRKTGLTGWEQYLKRIDAGNVRVAPALRNS